MMKMVAGALFSCFVGGGLGNDKGQCVYGN